MEPVGSELVSLSTICPEPLLLCREGGEPSGSNTPVVNYLNATDVLRGRNSKYVCRSSVRDNFGSLIALHYISI